MSRYFGWGGVDKGLLKEAQQAFPFNELKIGAGSQGKLFFHDIWRRAFNRDPDVGTQEIGDCVSWGAKHAIEALQTYEIYEKGDAEEWKYVFSPYLYGTGRVQIGGGRLNGDGSLGVWQAEAVTKYGAIPVDAPNCPRYSGSIAKKWGDRPGPPDEFLAIGKEHLLGFDFAAAKIRTWDQLVNAITNGYPVTVASTVGFDEMKPRSDGFHYKSGSWPHQLCIIGVDNEYKTPYALIENSWGDVHGTLTDFYGGKDLPRGCLRVRKQDVQYMLDADDSFAYSNFNGFKRRKIVLDKDWFKLF